MGKEQMMGEILCILNRNNTEDFLRRILTVALAYEKVMKEAEYFE